MKWVSKIVVILLVFLSVQAFAYKGDYVPAFKLKKSKNFSEFQDDMKQDMFYIRKLMNLKEEKLLGFMKADKDIQVQRILATKIN